MSPSHRMAEIHLLAHEIEWANAIERCRLNGRFSRCTGRNAKALRKQAIASEFDPLAATCLADLIAVRLFGRAVLDQ